MPKKFILRKPPPPPLQNSRNRGSALPTREVVIISSDDESPRMYFKKRKPIFRIPDDEEKLQKDMKQQRSPAQNKPEEIEEEEMSERRSSEVETEQEFEYGDGDDDVSDDGDDDEDGGGDDDSDLEDEDEVEYEEIRRRKLQKKLFLSQRNGEVLMELKDLNKGKRYRLYHDWKILKAVDPHIRREGSKIVKTSEFWKEITQKGLLGKTRSWRSIASRYLRFLQYLSRTSKAKIYQLVEEISPREALNYYIEFQRINGEKYFVGVRQDSDERELLLPGLLPTTTMNQAPLRERLSHMILPNHAYNTRSNLAIANENSFDENSLGSEEEVLSDSSRFLVDFADKGLAYESEAESENEYLGQKRKPNQALSQNQNTPHRRKKPLNLNGNKKKSNLHKRIGVFDEDNETNEPQIVKKLQAHNANVPQHSAKKTPRPHPEFEAVEDPLIVKKNQTQNTHIKRPAQKTPRPRPEVTFLEELQALADKKRTSREPAPEPEFRNRPYEIRNESGENDFEKFIRRFLN